MSGDVKLEFVIFVIFLLHLTPKVPIEAQS